MKALIVHQNQQVVRDIAFCLGVRYPNITVASAVDGRTGIEQVEAESPDLVLVNSPPAGMETLEFIKTIREFSDVPLIVLSEGKSEMDRANELETGADEYVIMPFSPIELLARVKALLRRTQGNGFSSETPLSFGDVVCINFVTREVLVQGKPIKLTPIEYHLLSELIRNEGRVLTHSALLGRVWGSEYTDEYSFIKKYIHRLRSKIEPDASKPQMILNERGIGYKFVKPY